MLILPLGLGALGKELRDCNSPESHWCNPARLRYLLPTEQSL